MPIKNSYFKKGYTIVEVVVAMGIFVVILTLLVGGFAAVSRMKALSSTMKETQQKTRNALERITRLARQAEKVEIGGNGDTLDLYFNISTSNKYAYRFEIKNNGLYQSECSGSLQCNNWTNSQNLYEGVNLLNEISKDSKFVKINSIPPTLEVELFGKVPSPLGNNPYYTDEINLKTTIILEAIK